MSTLIVKTFPFLKHYKRATDDKRQVAIRVKIYSQNSGKRKLQKVIDFHLLSEDGQIIRATEAEFKNRNSTGSLKYRIAEVEISMNKAINKILMKNLKLDRKNVLKFTYHPEKEDDNKSEELVYNEDVERIFGYPVPIAVWEEVGSQQFKDPETGEPVSWDDFETIAQNIESEYYAEKHEKEHQKELEKKDLNERYRLGEYDKNNIFECFGFCWSKHPQKNDSLVPTSYKGLILRLYDYRYNANPVEHVKLFNDDWIDDFLKFLVAEGHANVHPKNYTPFNLVNYKVELIKADRRPYKYQAFEKIVKQLKRYIFQMQKYKIINYTRNVKFIDAKDYVGRNVNTTGYTRREHSLTKEEFKNLCQTDFGSDKLNIARDMFIIAVLGGGFRGEEFYNDEVKVEKYDGKLVLHLYRAKTQTTELNPIFGELINVVQRYNGGLPQFLSETELRSSLREIANILNFDRVISSPNTYLNSSGGLIKYIVKDIFSIYFARKTFVQFLDSAGMGDEDIIEFTSHSKTDTLKHYRGRLSVSNKFKLIEGLKLDL